MHRRWTAFLFACGLLCASATLSAAQTPGSPDSSVARPDTTGRPDTTHVAPPTTPAATAPAVTTPPPTPPPAAAPAAAPPPSTPPPASAPQQQSGPSKLYFGGSATVSFGSTSTIGIYPMVGYQATPRLSAGLDVGYERVSYSHQSTNNYGLGIFGRSRVGRNAFAHAEYQTTNYEIFHNNGTSSREWVPFLLLGGGVMKPIAPHVAAYGEVLFDVLQDDRSPYGWSPIVYFGVSAGY